MPEPGVPRPSFIYGSAWKEDATARLIRTAVRAGFQAIDTANQPRHYQEPLAGAALETLASEGVRRAELWVQTKFTPASGHDHRIPYDARADLTTQVQQSFESSLRHLGTTYVDSYLLHGPYTSPGLGPADWEVWQAIEGIHRSGQARMIGVSNVNAGQLAELVEHADVRPMAVQNRCFAHRGWDRRVRDICRSHGIMYQGFSLLTANPEVRRHPKVTAMAQRLGVSAEQIIFRFAMRAGIVPLTGTTSERHMQEDLEVYGFDLTPIEVDMLESLEG